MEDTEFWRVSASLRPNGSEHHRCALKDGAGIVLIWRKWGSGNNLRPACKEDFHFAIKMLLLY
jgi:hypothetical protein